MNRISTRLFLVIPGLLAGYLLIGTFIAFGLSAIKADVTSQTLVGNILLLFLFPTKLINDLYSNIVPFSGTFLLASWFIILFAVFSLSFYNYRKSV